MALGPAIKAFRPTPELKLSVENLNQLFSISVGLVVSRGYGDLQRPPTALLPALAPRGREEGRSEELDRRESPVPHTLYRPEGRS